MNRLLSSSITPVSVARNRGLDEDIDYLESMVELHVVAFHRLTIAAAQVFAQRGGRHYQYRVRRYSAAGVICERVLQCIQGFCAEPDAVTRTITIRNRGKSAGRVTRTNSDRDF